MGTVSQHGPHGCQAGIHHCVSRKSPGELQEAQLTPASGSGGFPEPPKPFHIFPEETTSPLWWGWCLLIPSRHTATRRVKPVTADVPRVFCKPALDHHTTSGLASTDTTQAAPISVPATGPELGSPLLCPGHPIAPLMDVPFLHPLHFHFLGTQPPFSERKQYDLIFPSSPSLSCDKAPGLLSGHP